MKEGFVVAYVQRLRAGGDYLDITQVEAACLFQSLLSYISSEKQQRRKSSLQSPPEDCGVSKASVTGEYPAPRRSSVCPGRNVIYQLTAGELKTNVSGPNIQVDMMSTDTKPWHTYHHKVV